MIKRISFSFLCAFILLSGHAFSATDSESFLKRWDAYIKGDRIEIEIQLEDAFRILNKGSTTEGDLLRIQLIPSNLRTRLTDTNGQNTLRWTGDANIPLEVVDTEVLGGSRSLLVRFTKNVKFLSVTSANQDKSVIITIPAPAKVEAEIKKQEQKQKQKREATALPEVDQGIFAINLVSSRKRKILSEHENFPFDKGKHVYMAKALINNKNWYRVRLGFFTSLKKARQHASKLKGSYPESWVSEMTAYERDMVLKGNKLADMSQVKVKPLAGYKLPEVTVQRLEDLMEKAKKSMASKELGRATIIYNRVVAYPVQPYQRNALEFLGLARERKNQLAQAKSTYEQYLKLYPDGANAARVKQRLAGLVTLSMQPRDRLGKKGKSVDDASNWDVYGSFGQYYRRNTSSFNDESSEVTQSLLTNSLDVNARRRTDEDDIQIRLTGGYDHDVLDSAESEFRASSAYFDYATRDQEHLFRIGRQTRSSGGVLGRFDGVYYGKKIGAIYRANIVAGFPVESTADSLNEDKKFIGVSLDIGPVYDYWNFNLFGIEQRLDGHTDRRSIGGEVRYFKDGKSIFGLLDYDIYFNDLNILYMLGSWPISPKTTINFIADHRKSPLLSLSNALQGQTVTKIKLLKDNFTWDEIKQMAQDRAATSTTGNFGISHTLNPTWQVKGDLRSLLYLQQMLLGVCQRLMRPALIIF
ncbi:MAG: SPOR domain-containing protein [gamma proteobacterium symbiont of Bathyaustriella thionipta]|nr:SPOR domain-containing protein [gamma proteobacterium symbiont of Bathyaustriella thionipta]MCU7949358.1 SPOR domain-containing protein [gamma proteobacterium symbiont of Bathyaustriella thionipta]MCU7954673.1 SPOR domain-containing protein [gamma proteobacterium symbiont of Bathyaustriella thionipta]MCU7955957.1 SPOR domain-containing protein [gamma proteobacterium symbiont of Bathyaustriella thionipta]MCU7968185.1 SPOR domain-containing protein [gamma proteobacterium symbiont of Bathyaustr